MSIDIQISSEAIESVDKLYAENNEINLENSEINSGHITVDSLESENKSEVNENKRVAIEPGIYFDLPFEQYIRLDARSHSEFKKLEISPYNFWYHVLHAPDFTDDKISPQMLWGKMLHTMVLEPETFEDSFAVRPNPDHYPEALRTATDLKQWLKDNGEGSSGNKPELIDRIQIMASQMNRDVLIWDNMIEEFEHNVEERGQLIVTDEMFEKAQSARKMIAINPDYNDRFTDGYAEVTIVWDDEETGVRLKARIDYLTANTKFDLKTFNNFMSINFETAMIKAIFGNKYHLQSVMYMDGFRALQKLSKKKGVIIKTANNEQWELAQEALANENHKYALVFIEQQEPFEILGKGFEERESAEGSRNNYFISGENLYRRLLKNYVENVNKYGSDAWINWMPFKALSDIECPQWALED